VILGLQGSLTTVTKIVSNKVLNLLTMLLQDGYRSPELLLMSDTLSYGKEVDIWAVGRILGEITDG